MLHALINAFVNLSFVRAQDENLRQLQVKFLPTLTCFFQVLLKITSKINLLFLVYVFTFHLLHWRIEEQEMLAFLTKPIAST